MRVLMVWVWGLAALAAVSDSHAQGSKGENYSDRPPAVLFNSDCTGAGCHAGPQGLANGRTATSLAEYLREHYTNGQASAQALARYLSGVPGANSRRATMQPERETSPRERPTRDSAREPSKREPAAQEEPRKDETPSFFSGFPLFPFFSPPTPPSEEAKPETVKPEPAPPRQRARTKPRDEPPSTPAARRREATKPATETPSEPPSTETQPGVTPPASQPSAKNKDDTSSRTASRSREEKKIPPKPESPSAPQITTQPGESISPARSVKKKDGTSASTASRRREQPKPPPTAETPSESSPTGTIPSNASPPSPPASVQQDGADKREGSGSARARSKPPYQIPNTNDPNALNPDEVFRPARPHQPPVTDNEKKPPVVTAAPKPIFD